MINFNVPPCADKAMEYIQECVRNQKICGDGAYTKKCSRWIEEKTGTAKCLLTTSCTHATELAALLLPDIKAGDEVIMPAFTFVSTADAFVLRGAVPVFVDIRPDTMNMDEKLVEAVVTERTKAIVPVHYAGVSCEMDTIMEVADRHGLAVVEDAAQGIMSTYKGRALGTFGNFGCFSFHETKNYSMGEGGALLIRDEKDVEEAEIIREKGTNRSKFYRGQIDRTGINEARLEIWNRYYERLQPLAEAGKLDLPVVPENCVHNGHMFYVKAADIEVRTALIDHLKEKGIKAVFHYIPLHTAPAGQKFGRFHGEDKYTTRESERLMRLPMYYGLTLAQVDEICDSVKDFFG